jgi:hypothetical protein
MTKGERAAHAVPDTPLDRTAQRRSSTMQAGLNHVFRQFIDRLLDGIAKRTTSGRRFWIVALPFGLLHGVERHEVPSFAWRSESRMDRDSTQPGRTFESPRSMPPFTDIESRSIEM